MAQYLNLKPVELDALSDKKRAAFKWPGRLLLPKYDGCMALVGFMAGKPDFIMSRTGEAVKSLDHIYEDILKRYPAVAGLKLTLCFIGEAWRPGTEFAAISGEFRRHSPQLGLGFAAFDAVRYSHGPDGPVLSSPRPYRQRLELLQSCERGGSSNCHPPLPVICESEEHAWRYARNLKALGGYDGAVCSDPEATYTPGSGKCGSFIKLKPLQRFTLEVVGVVGDLGEKTGRVTAALQVRFKGKVCGVGTGFSNDDAAAWVANPGLIVGKLIDVDCMAVYSGPDGMMREPRFVGFRTDVLTPEY